jgi:hypothetical protein
MWCRPKSARRPRARFENENFHRTDAEAIFHHRDAEGTEKFKRVLAGVSPRELASLEYKPQNPKPESAEETEGAEEPNLLIIELSLRGSVSRLDSTRVQTHARNATYADFGTSHA